MIKNKIFLDKHYQQFKINILFKISKINLSNRNSNK